MAEPATQHKLQLTRETGSQPGVGSHGPPSWGGGSPADRRIRDVANVGTFISPQSCGLPSKNSERMIAHVNPSPFMPPSSGWILQLSSALQRGSSERESADCHRRRCEAVWRRVFKCSSLADDNFTSLASINAPWSPKGMF